MKFLVDNALSPLVVETQTALLLSNLKEVVEPLNQGAVVVFLAPS